MPREMLKLRKGDSAIMIKADGSVEMAGVNDKPLMNDKGMISPVILFAAAWAKKDDVLMKNLVINFKNCVREGFFGPEAQSDFKSMEIEGEKNRIRQEQAAASGAVTMGTTSGAVTMEQRPNIDPTITQEEYEKRQADQAYIQTIVDKGQDPRVKRQIEAIKAGATSITEKPMADFTPDLPVEQTMKYQKATPEEQQKMKMEETLKKLNESGATTPEEAKEILNSSDKLEETPIVGNVTIEEGANNENK